MSSRLQKFLSYYKPYRGTLALDLICAFIVAAITLTLPLCIGLITKNILEGQSPHKLSQILLVGALMLGLVALYAVCNYFADFQGHMMGSRMEADMRRDLFAHFQKLSFSFYDSQRTGQLMSRLTNDLYNIGELAHHAPEDLAIAVVKAVGVFVILATVNLKLTLMVFLFLPPMLAFALYSSHQMRQALQVMRRRIGDINAQVEDTLAGIRVVQSFGNQEQEQHKFDQQNQRFLDSMRQSHRAEMLFSNGMTAFTQLLTVAVAVFGGSAIAGGSLGLPDLVTYLLYVGILVDPINRFVNLARLFQEGGTGFERFAEIMEIEPEIQDREGTIELNHVPGNVQFKNLTFRYHEDHDYVLKDLSLSIRAGEFVALVGPSGVGKTTLCSLIPRFYEVTEGKILLDGRDIRDIKLSSLRQHIGVVQQEVYLFAGTVAENIRYGKLGATHEEIVEAAKKANAHQFILALPEGYDTDIGQRGVKLSGGQKQRLSIARVFLKNPPILIFDEATSALDNESERAVQNSMERLTNNRTTLVIAHRLSTVRKAGRILVLSDEGIAEQGTHEALVRAGGVYANLYSTQLRN
ncbi:MAG: ABC transporter ATP-binding protein [Thermaceae bacterium]|nr:ABC transporter ATP-binding protein [Thermaceae bacterium]